MTEPTLDEIIQKIEVGSMIALTKSRADGSRKHHLDFVKTSKQSLVEWAIGIVGKSEYRGSRLFKPARNQLRAELRRKFKKELA